MGYQIAEKIVSCINANSAYHVVAIGFFFKSKKYCFVGRPGTTIDKKHVCEKPYGILLSLAIDCETNILRNDGPFNRYFRMNFVLNLTEICYT